MQILPPLPWVAVIRADRTAVLSPGARAGWRPLVVGCLTFIALFGLWDSAMVTLASILVAVPIGVAGGLLLGIAAQRSAWIDAALRPVLDLMQTIPVFAYLVSGADPVSGSGRPPPSSPH